MWLWRRRFPWKFALSCFVWLKRVLFNLWCIFWVPCVWISSECECICKSCRNWISKPFSVTLCDLWNLWKAGWLQVLTCITHTFIFQLTLVSRSLWSMKSVKDLVTSDFDLYYTHSWSFSVTLCDLWNLWKAGWLQTLTCITHTVDPSQSPFVICEICERLGGFASPQNLVYCDAVQEDGMPLS